MDLHAVDYTLIGIYFLFVIGVGIISKLKVKTAGDFLLSGRSTPLWISSLAFISANLGAQELIGMVASGAKYGMMTVHFYWIGAIPAMLFLGLFMMPFYYGSKARSVPEYLALRFDDKTRAFNALTFAVMTVFSSGISLYALAILLEQLLRWDFNLCVLSAAAVVMAYTYVGGLTSAIYNEVLQFCLIVFGIAPVVYAGLAQLGGWHEVTSALPPAMVHAWSYTGSAADNPMGVNAGSLIMGLGFFLSFGYWCTDYLVIQRAMAARDIASAQTSPVIATFPKALLPLITILPGMLAIALISRGFDFALPLKPDGRTDFDLTLPTMLAHYYPHGLLGIGLTALLASFMSGMAGNVTAFNSVVVYDLYETFVRKGAPDAHYLRIGKLVTVLGIALSVATAYVARGYNNIMDLLQLVFGFVNAPLFAVFLLGMATKRTTGRGAFTGLMVGTAAAFAAHGLTTAEGKGGWMGEALMTFSTSMAQSFFIAIVAFGVCFTTTVLVSFSGPPRPLKELAGLVYGLTTEVHAKLPWYKAPGFYAIAATLLVIALNIAVW